MPNRDHSRHPPSSLHATGRGLGVLLAMAALLTAASNAQVTNGSFEDAPNHLNGWMLGPGARVEALQSSNLAPNTLVVPDGNWMVMISTGPGNVPTAPGGDFDANGTGDNDSGTLSTTFTTVQPGESLCFDWAFLSDEVGPGGQGQLNFDDLFDVTVDGVSILNGSVNKPGGVSPYPDTVAYDSLRYTVNSMGLTDNSDFGTAAGSGATPWQNLCATIANAGTFALQFLVADQGDSSFDSALVIDDVQVIPLAAPLVQITQSDQALTEFKDGSFQLSQVDNLAAAADADGGTLVFRSTGDYQGDNPGLVEQIWIAEQSGTLYDIRRVTAAVGAEFDEPAISADGLWVVFASTADLVPPGNADGNQEIFRYDVSGDSFQQITSTLSCTSDQATINDGGSRVAFVSDCNFGFGAGDAEIVYWDGAFTGMNTSGCTNRGPRISRNTAGRYITFLSDCIGSYGPSNGDGNLEVVQWDAQLNLYTQLTVTGGARTNDAVDSSEDGRYVSLVSDADLEAGQNSANALVAFRYDRNSGSFLQLTDSAPLTPVIGTSIDTTGAFVAVESIDFLTGGPDISVVAASAPRVLLPVASGNLTVFIASPAIAVLGASTRVAFLSNGDFTGGNGDLNPEIWISGVTFNPPVVTTYCSAPGVTIPDRNNGGVSETITVADTGALTDLNVSFVIDHTHVGDLRVVLRHMDTGTQRRLLDRPGRPPGPGCSGDDIDATVDDNATSPIEDECVTPGPVSIFGTFLPHQTLSDFNGEDLSGDWRLTVSDRRNNNVGTLVEWCLVPEIN